MTHQKLLTVILIGYALLGSSAAGDAATILKEDLAGVPAKKTALIFRAFAQVPLYYLVTEQGDGLADQYSQEKPEEFPGLLPRPPQGFMITLYYAQGMADQMKSIVEKKDGHRYRIKSTTLENILHQQYAKIGQPPSLDPTNPQPDFLVVDSLFHVPAFPEYLMNSKTGQPYVTEQQGMRFIPAFIARNIDAIELQKNLGGEKVYARTGMDFRSFLKFVEEHAETDAPVIAFFGEQQ